MTSLTTERKHQNVVYVGKPSVKVLILGDMRWFILARNYMYIVYVGRHLLVPLILKT
jgi:hypothetical protein